MPKIRFTSKVNEFFRIVDDAVDGRLRDFEGPFRERLKRAFGGSSPGNDYPGKLLGRAQRSIYTRRRGKFLIEYGTRGPVAERLPGHAQKVVISPINGKFLTIPMSLDARKHASRGGTARTFKKKLFKITTKKGMSFLVQEASKAVKKATGKKLVFHYYLHEGDIERKARKGLDDAVEAMLPWIRTKLVG